MIALTIKQFSAAAQHSQRWNTFLSINPVLLSERIRLRWIVLADVNVDHDEMFLYQGSDLRVILKCVFQHMTIQAPIGAEI